MTLLSGRTPAVLGICRPLAVLGAFTATALTTPASPAVAQETVPAIARGEFDARLTVPGTRTAYHSRWRLSPSCLGAACASIDVRIRRPDGNYDFVTLRNDQGVYRGRLRTRAVCRGRLAARSGTISLAIRVTRTVKREMLSGRETIVTGVGGELRIRSAAGACPRRRSLGRLVRVTAPRVDVPELPRPDFRTLPARPSMAAGTNIVRFTDDSSPSDVVAWSWDFGDPASGSANRASGPSVTHLFAAAGSYRVTLRIADRLGQVASRAKSIVVSP
jgi:hypothetical protein